MWAFPSNDLQTRPTLISSSCEAAIAADRPAPPAPITKTSNCILLIPDISNIIYNPQVLISLIIPIDTSLTYTSEKPTQTRLNHAKS